MNELRFCLGSDEKIKLGCIFTKKGAITTKLQKWTATILIILLSLTVACSEEVTKERDSRSKGGKGAEIGLHIAAQVDAETPLNKETKRASDASNAEVPAIDLLLPERNSEPRNTPITHVIIHFISNAAAKPHDPYDLEDILSLYVEAGVSAHYMIGREGEIYQLVPEDRIAYHAGKGHLPNFPHYRDRLNDYAIGIELMAVGTKDEMRAMLDDARYDAIRPAHVGFTDAQYDALDRLLDDILTRYPAIERNRDHIIGHEEYAPGRKTDPGSLFDWDRLGL